LFGFALFELFTNLAVAFILNADIRAWGFRLKRGGAFFLCPYFGNSMASFDYQPFLLSLKLAAVVLVVLLLIGLPLVYGLFFYRGPLRQFFKAMISLPLVLPPTVLGYYLLLALRPEGWVSQLIGADLAFSFSGLVFGSVIFSLPFLVNPILAALEGLPRTYQEAAYTLGHSSWSTYLRILLPNVRSSILAGSVMAFAHTIGEFGVVLMIGGSIPGVTRVASVEIYQQVEAGRYELADLYAGGLLLFSLLLLMGVYRLEGRKR
jgi:molybdate transport system permease protein